MNKPKKCTMCAGTGKIIVGSGFMAKLTGNSKTCPNCLGTGQK